MATKQLYQSRNGSLEGAQGVGNDKPVQVNPKNFKIAGLPSLTTQEILNDPEWARFPRSGQRLMGLSRSSLYILATERRITTKSLKRPGQKRGIRFVHLPSVAALIEGADS